MKILSLHIDGFGKFHDRDISFEDGLNVVYGKNEAGKSTLHTFIKGMLFGIERQRGRASKNDTYSKFQPWTQSGVYEGYLRVECDGQIYRIERRFQKGDKRLCVINETTGKEEENNKALWDKLRCGLSETAYDNTISMRNRRWNGFGAAKLYCKLKHLRKHCLKHHKGQRLFKSTAQAVRSPFCAGSRKKLYSSSQRDPKDRTGNICP